MDALHVPEMTNVCRLLLCIFLYIIYMRFFHRLSKFPGPLLASITNGWKAYYVYHLVLHEKLLELHMKYGPVVRIGPNHLHFWVEDAIAPIYKGGRKMGKTGFYNAFTAFNPNLFGGTDEDIHAIRRRQLSHGFSQVSIQQLEPLIDSQMQILIGKLRQHAKSGEPVDLKALLSLYVLDVLGDVAFGKSFNAQETGEAEQLPAINDHIFLAGVIGELPLQPVAKFLSMISPIPWMRRLVRSRNNLKAVCANRVRSKLEHPAKRPDLLKSLVEAKDPETGCQLTEQEINSEAFAVLVAGSHSTAGTLTLLIWNLLQSPGILDRVQSEVDTVLGPIVEGQTAYSINGLEAKLPYTMACVRENFRTNPVFTMPLWRRVGYPEGLTIRDTHIPSETQVCISNHALHHNPSIWGDDHETFNPDRWLDNDYITAKAKYVLPFSVGHRMCIGRNLAMTNILKTVTTLLSQFEFHPLRHERQVKVRSAGIGEMEGDFPCTVSAKA